MKFWKDVWVTALLGLLEQHCVDPASIDVNVRISAMVDDEGEWQCPDLNRLNDTEVSKYSSTFCTSWSG